MSSNFSTNTLRWKKRMVEGKVRSTLEPTLRWRSHWCLDLQCYPECRWCLDYSQLETLKFEVSLLVFHFILWKSTTKMSVVLKNEKKEKRSGPGGAAPSPQSVWIIWIQFIVHALLVFSLLFWVLSSWFYVVCSEFWVLSSFFLSSGLRVLSFGFCALS